MLRGPRPRPGSAGLPDALKTLRAVRDEPAPVRSAHRSDRWPDRAPPTISWRARRGAGAARRISAAASLPLSDLAARHRDVLAALSAHNGEQVSVAFAGPTATKLADALDELADEPSRGGPGGRAVRLCRAVRRRACRPRRARRRRAPACACASSAARSAADRQRPRRARRPGRRHLAAGEPHRCLAQPPDAARARTRSAGAPHRPFRARFRATARRARSDPDPRRQDRRHADGPVALHPAPRRRRGRALARRRSNAAKLISPGRASSISPTGSPRRRRGRRRRRRARRGRKASRSPKSSTGCAIPIRSTPSTSCGCGRSIRSMPSPAPPSAARSSTPPSANSRKPSQEPARRSGARTHRARPQTFRRARGFSRGARVLVAALRAHRALVRALGNRAPRRRCGDRCRDPGRASKSRSTRQLQAARHRRPHRARQRRALHHPRLQDRLGAHRKAGAHRPRAAAHAGSRDAAPGRFPGNRCRQLRSPSSPMCCSKAASRRAIQNSIKFKDGTPDTQADRALQKLTRAGDALRG